jgi:hypothetical protein
MAKVAVGSERIQTISRSHMVYNDAWCNQVTPNDIAPNIY